MFNLNSILLTAAAALMLAAAPQAVKAAQTDFACTPDEVMVFAGGQRLHVRCANSAGSIRYFALSAANPTDAARILTILTTALVAGRTLSIKYDPNDLSGSAIGCLTTDCRLIQAAGFGK